MDSSLRDFYLPLIFIAIVIGYQISLYFLYQYFKYKREKLELHNLLLGYALTFGFTLTAYTVRIINLYFLSESHTIFTIIVQITYILLWIGIMIFYLIISSPAFNKIMRTYLTKTLAILLIIPIISVIFLDIESLVFSAIAGLTLIICYPIILFFHKRLIKLTTGEIKKRLRLIVIGVILCFVSHFIGGYTPSYVLLKAYSDLLQIISAPIFIVGLAIIFLGVYKFPAFLEFGWREYLINFYIVNKTNYKILYTYDFQNINSKGIKNQPTRNSFEEKELFFSRGIIGIDTILSVISTSTNEVNKGLQQIKQGDFLILLNYGDESLSHIIFCLLVKKEMKSLNYFNKKAKDEFQKMYSPLLFTINQLDYYELNIFSGFDKVLKQMLK